MHVQALPSRRDDQPEAARRRPRRVALGDDLVVAGRRGARRRRPTTANGDRSRSNIADPRFFNSPYVHFLSKGDDDCLQELR